MGWPINNRDLFVVQQIIYRSCQIKAGIIENDEREDGLRAILNLGHTFGHAIETFSGYGYYRHGEVVAMGIILATRLARRLNLLEVDDTEAIIDLLQALGLNPPFPDLAPQDLVDLMYQDKKVRNGRLRLVLPISIGQVTIKDDVSRLLLEETIKQTQSHKS